MKMTETNLKHAMLDMMLNELERHIRANTDQGVYSGKTDHMLNYQEIYQMRHGHDLQSQTDK
jgi:hypothetical protein